ncbi:MAG: TetR/AcrR family transcriptional regulator [Firmicutes bacterium]|jgi:AcrR family transcriptional regulator|nr:TetR/AcrR family transcriptional regulator [Bacillota bacterium]
MYSGNNPVAIKSQDAIRNEFLKLLKIKPFNKISIKEINEQAKLARQTFYLLFSSKEEILEFHLDEVFLSFVNKVKENKNKSIEELVAMFLVFFEEHRELLKSLIDNKFHGLISGKFIQYFDILIDDMKIFKKNVSKLEIKYFKVFVSGAMVEVLSLWLNDDNAEIEELSPVVKKIIFGEMLEV